jgi:hypothetical protein
MLKKNQKEKIFFFRQVEFEKYFILPFLKN